MSGKVTGKTLIDNLVIARNVEQFYLSGYSYGTLPVNIMSPINNIFNINLIRKSSYQETLNDVFYKIHRYLLNHSLITYYGNKIPCNSIQSRKQKVQTHIIHDEFHKHLINNNLTGRAI